MKLLVAADAANNYVTLATENLRRRRPIAMCTSSSIMSILEQHEAAVEPCLRNGDARRKSVRGMRIQTMKAT